VEVHGWAGGDDVVPPAVDEPGVAERGESIQGRDRVADAMDDQLERPHPLLLAPEQEPQDETLNALGCLGQIVGLIEHRRYPPDGQRGGSADATAETYERATCRLVRSGATAVLLTEQCQRIKTQALGDALHGLERQVALATLNAAHVGAMDAEHVGKRLLTQALRFTVCAEILSHRSL
jgi:hypothetical protein